MAKLPILTFPNPRLRNKAQPVREVDGKVRQLVADMFETMYAAPGIGLAAIQVDVPLRVVVIDVSDANDAPLCLINPEILELSGVEQMDEGACRSPASTRACPAPSVSGCAPWTATASPSRSRPTVCWRCASSMRSITSTASCSSITSPSLKRQRIRRRLEKDQRGQTPAQGEARRRAI